MANSEWIILNNLRFQKSAYIRVEVSTGCEYEGMLEDMTGYHIVLKLNHSRLLGTAEPESMFIAIEHIVSITVRDFAWRVEDYGPSDN